MLVAYCLLHVACCLLPVLIASSLFLVIITDVISIVDTFNIAVDNSVCKSLGYITKHSMAGSYSLCRLTPWGVNLALGGA